MALVVSLAASLAAVSWRQDEDLRAMRTLEAKAGQRWARRVSLSGKIEVDATALGKFWVGQANKRFSEDTHPRAQAFCQSETLTNSNSKGFRFSEP